MRVKVQALGFVAHKDLHPYQRFWKVIALTSTPPFCFRRRYSFRCGKAWGGVARPYGGYHWIRMTFEIMNRQHFRNFYHTFWILISRLSKKKARDREMSCLPESAWPWTSSWYRYRQHHRNFCQNFKIFLMCGNSSRTHWYPPNCRHTSNYYSKHEYTANLVLLLWKIEDIHSQNWS